MSCVLFLIVIVFVYDVVKYTKFGRNYLTVSFNCDVGENVGDVCRQSILVTISRCSMRQFCHRHSKSVTLRIWHIKILSPTWMKLSPTWIKLSPTWLKCHHSVPWKVKIARRKVKTLSNTFKAFLIIPSRSIWVKHASKRLHGHCTKRKNAQNRETKDKGNANFPLYLSVMLGRSNPSIPAHVQCQIFKLVILGHLRQCNRYFYFYIIYRWQMETNNLFGDIFPVSRNKSFEIDENDAL